MFTNGVLLMGVMLDPTSFDYLSDEQKKLGLTTATNLVLRMRGIIEEDEVEDDVQDEEEDYSDVDCVSDEELGALLKKGRLLSQRTSSGKNVGGGGVRPLEEKLFIEAPLLLIKK